MHPLAICGPKTQRVQHWLKRKKYRNR